MFMSERLNTVGWAGVTGKYRDEQVAHIDNWQVVPNLERTTAAMHVIRQVPSNSSTETIVNPMDVGEDYYRFREDAGDERTIPVGRRF